jgi:hypothetical protein
VIKYFDFGKGWSNLVIDCQKKKKNVDLESSCRKSKALLSCTKYHSGRS